MSSLPISTASLKRPLIASTESSKRLRTQNPTGIKQLPPEIVERVFSYLNLTDLQNCASTNKSMKILTVSWVGYSESEKVLSFIDYLKERLETLNLSKHKEPLEKIAKNVVFQDLSNLPEIKKSVLCIKEELIESLKDLDVETIENLKNEVPNGNVFISSSKKDFLTLVLLNKRVDNTWKRFWLAELNNNALQKELLDACKACIKIKELDRALEFAKMLSDRWIKSDALIEVCKVYIKLEQFTQALEAAEIIPNEWEKSNALIEVCNACIKLEQFTQALGAAQKIADEQDKSLALAKICKAYTELKELEQALELSKTIPNRWEKSNVQIRIYSAYIKLQKSDQLFEATQKIADEQDKSLALTRICNAYTGLMELDQALKVSEMISCEGKKSLVLTEICQAYLKLNELDRALDIARSIPKNDHKDLALYHIAKALTQAGKSRESVTIANLISNEGIKRAALKDNFVSFSRLS